MRQAYEESECGGVNMGVVGHGVMKRLWSYVNDGRFVDVLEVPEMMAKMRRVWCFVQ